MITAIALDDEPLALKVLSQHCEKIEFLQLKKTFTNPDEVSAYLEDNKVDLIFLDIQMPDINGMQFYKNLPIKPAVVFTTAFKDFAVDGFNVEAIDYLLKPFSFDRFLKAINKVKTHLVNKAFQETNENVLYVKVNYELLKINLRDINFIEALDDYIKIHIKPMPILTLMTLKGVLEKLPPHEFIRVHRSYIVPISKITKFSKTKISLEGKEIPIGTSYSDVYDDLLQNHKLII